MKKTAVNAPGRINVIGEHTDYNNGYVLPAAINLGIEMELQTSNFSKIKLTAIDVKETFEFDINDTSININGWPNYLFGVVKELQKSGVELCGFNATFSGDVPQGAGMSSSAALECSLAFGLNELFELKLDSWDLIKAGQLAEHNYVGTKCGIMDQFASIMGKQHKAILLDCKSLEYEYVPLQLNDHSILLLNTNVEHSLAGSEYNTRRNECESGVEILQKTYENVKSLRDVSMGQLEALKNNFDETHFNRCKYVIEENTRTLKAKESLQQNNLTRLGALMYQSHKGLQNLYEVSCPELDFLVDAAKTEKAIIGSRMMGGGFGGSTISIISKQAIGKFVETVSKAYKTKFGIDLTPYIVSIENGASVIT